MVMQAVRCQKMNTQQHHMWAIVQTSDITVYSWKRSCRHLYTYSGEL